MRTSKASGTLQELTERLVPALAQKLQELPESDERFFHPHSSDTGTVASLLRQKGNHYYVYVDGTGQLIGYGMLRTFGKYTIPTLGCVIWPSYRRQGHAKKLVRLLLEKAQQLGFETVALKVFTDNKAAYELYKKVGFERSERDAEDGLVWMQYDLKNKRKGSEQRLEEY